jgi:signal peptidase II
MRDPANKPIRLALALTVLVCCIACDQVTKSIATRTLCGRPPQSYFFGTIGLEYALNPGGCFGLGRDLEPQLRFWAFVVVNVVFLVGIVYFLVANWRMHFGMFVAVIVLLAGGLGNLSDRMAQSGAVTDFVHIGIGSLRTGVFNVADVAQIIGAVALVTKCLTVQAAAEAGR